MKLKLLIVLPNLKGGGAEKVIITLLKNIDRRKFQPILLLLNNEGALKNQIPGDIEVVDLKINKVSQSLLYLIKSINKIKPDIVLSTIIHLNFAILFIKPFLNKRTKVVIRESNVPSRKLSNFGKNKRRIFKFLYKHLYKRSNLIITQTERMKADLLKYIQVEKQNLVTIHNPIDINKIKELANLYTPYKNDGSKKVIVAAGKLEYQKGFDVLLQSFSLVLNKNKNVLLYILGEGSLKRELLDLSKQLSISNNVRFLGFKDNPYPYFYNANLFVLSSRFEGFPNVILDALACGTKVISTDCESGPSEILGESNPECLVEVEDITSLGQKILEALNDEVGIIKSETVERFNISDITYKYEKVLLGTID